MAKPMAQFLEKLLTDHPNGVQSMIQFYSGPEIHPGALRRAQDAKGKVLLDGLYELQGPATDGHGNSVIASRFFDADAVEQVIVLQAPSSIVKPS